MKRVTVIVLDSLGIGALPDAESYGDKGADTLGHIQDSYSGFSIPNLRRLGFGNIQDAAGGRLSYPEPEGCYGKMMELSKGKDTITGHWEIAGIYTAEPFITYPDGFPHDFIKAFEKEIGRQVLANRAASGTEIIKELGQEHESTGRPIVYTSADSVFQIAANVEIIPLKELYHICEVARKLLVGKWPCGRVIARPYVIKDGVRVRTSDRRDYAVSPPEPTILDHISQAGKQVCAVGKISDIFNEQGITRSIHTMSNMDGVDKTIRELQEPFEGLIFTNLVDFDSKYGHRRDPVGYGKAIEDFDGRLPDIMASLRDDDVLILCADHGNDPVHNGFDHTREYVPVVVYGKRIKAGIDLGIRSSFADLGATVAEILGVQCPSIGKSFFKQLI